MQRFFTAFPDGGPGFGLLVLRIAAALSVVVQAAALLARTPAATLDAGRALLAIVSGLAVLLGLFTLGSATILVATLAWFWLQIPAEALRPDGLASLLTMADAVAIALLGPGAFSIDARRFGRREIVIPRDASRLSS